MAGRVRQAQPLGNAAVVVTRSAVVEVVAAVGLVWELLVLVLR